MTLEELNNDLATLKTATESHVIEWQRVGSWGTFFSTNHEGKMLHCHFLQQAYGDSHKAHVYVKYGEQEAEYAQETNEHTAWSELRQIIEDNIEAD